MSSSIVLRRTTRFSSFLVSRVALLVVATLLFCFPATPIFAQNVASTRGAKNAGAAESVRLKPENAVSPIAPHIAILENPEVERALVGNDVYVEPSMQHMAPSKRIAQAMKSATQEEFPVDVLVIPPSWLGAQSTRGCAEELLQFSRDENALAIVVAGRDIAFAGGDFDDATRAQMIEGAARTFDSEGYAAGIAQIAGSVAAHRKAQNERRNQIAGILIGALCGGAYWLFRHLRRKSQRTLLDARTHALSALENFSPRVEKLSSDFDYALLGEDDEARCALLLSSQTRVNETFSRAQRRGANAQTLSDWHLAATEIENAEREYSRAKNVLCGLPESDEASENAMSQVVEVPPLGSDLAGARVGFALCFFSSQPTPRGEMTSVGLEMRGQRRRVWSSRESAARVLADVPRVAVLDYGNGQRAWFDVPHFNPWANAEELETLPMSEIAASMAAQNLKLGGCYIGFGRDENGWFSPDYIGWNGAAHIARETLQAGETQSATDSQAATAPSQSAICEEKTTAPRETFEIAPRVLDAS